MPGVKRKTPRSTIRKTTSRKSKSSRKSTPRSAKSQKSQRYKKTRKSRKSTITSKSRKSSKPVRSQTATNKQYGMSGPMKQTKHTMRVANPVRANSGMSLDELQFMAKSKGIPFGGLSRTKLIKKINNYMY